MSEKCDIEATENPADRVYGVVFRIAAAEESALDEAAGLAHGYRKGSDVTLDLDLDSIGIRQSRSSIRRLALTPTRRYADPGIGT